MSDKAERLHSLIGRMQTASQEISVKQPGGGTSTAFNLPLWQSFGLVASSLGYGDYGEFREAFLALCYSIRDDVRTIPMQKETVRASWLSCIEAFSKVFDANNFGSPTHQVFANHFSGRNLEILDAISERFQITGVKESTPAEMEEALSAVREVIKEFQKAEKLDARIAAVLSHYLQQIETVFRHTEDFGDETFWKVYKEIFATFMQVHPIIAGLDNGDEIASKIKVVWNKLALRSIAGISLSANLVQIAQGVWPLLHSSH
ncbi:hypothetical protein QA648_00490 [Rhizobium sp. CB3171]|uniref:hypothetical protein n=1 Tax=Rhizobium sp. CB3171 TaxID=3039157 RepID=UPI0024B04622|nr:hypothetical protein [Rhizobium sp. CB3171]WFU02297.1 hypothetical protein QA648_00490 [Rhizobium sp. CB3171]